MPGRRRRRTRSPRSRPDSPRRLVAVCRRHPGHGDAAGRDGGDSSVARPRGLVPGLGVDAGAAPWDGGHSGTRHTGAGRIGRDPVTDDTAGHRTRAATGDRPGGPPRRQAQEAASDRRLGLATRPHRSGSRHSRHAYLGAIEGCNVPWAPSFDLGGVPSRARYARVGPRCGPRSRDRKTGGNVAGWTIAEVSRGTAAAVSRRRCTARVAPR
jgi:hypothetical protein